MTATLVGLTLAGLLGAACGGPGGRTHDGALAGLSFTTATGASARVADLRGTPVVLNVWQQTCTPCKLEMPALERVHRELGERVHVVGIDSQDDPARARAFAADLGITYPLWMDELGDVFAALDLATIPTTVFLDGGGRIVATHTGAITADELRRTITERLGVSP